MVLDFLENERRSDAIKTLQTATAEYELESLGTAVAAHSLEPLATISLVKELKKDLEQIITIRKILIY